MTRASGLVLLGAVVLLVSAGCSATRPDPMPAPLSTAAPAPTPTASRTYRAASVTVTVTFYAAYDNDPAGSREIAHPGDRHRVAGGTGTFEDPLTLATDPRELPVGSMVYVPRVRKYFVMEDDCAPCIDEWTASRTPHVDLWLNNGNGARVVACEELLTPDAPTAIEYDPPPGRPLDTRPLFTADGRCTQVAATGTS